MASRSHRWIVDLQACQTEGSAQRGVGRYSSALFDAARVAAGAVDFRAVVSDALPYAVELRGVPAERIVHMPALPEGLGCRRWQGGPQDDIDALLLSHRLAPLKADLIHLSHVFEGFSDRVALPSHAFKAPGQVLSATLFDLIPLLFQDQYFQSPEFKQWYYSRLDWLRNADLLLAISESSRHDAIELLGIDPQRIVTVHGGVGEQFVPAQDRVGKRADLCRRYHLRDRFVLYTGGDDHRKNIAGAIRGYAELPASLRQHSQLVIVCSMHESRQAMYTDIGRRAGLAEHDLVITGFVPEADLVAFYQCCAAFVFPSLYEGLGLPVLEAMACGAPTIGGNNSSIRELIARPDALFDAASSTSTAQALARVLTDDAFAQELSEYGLARARQFTWSKTANLAVEAMTEAVMRAEHAGIQTALNGWLPKKRLAVLTPLPPCRSGIADYNSKFLPFLARHFDIDLVVDNYEIEDVSLSATFHVLRAEQFEQVAHLYDAILYEFGNSEFHRYMLPLLKRFPGIVGLHDAFLSGLFGYLDFHLGDTGSYPRTMIATHGSQARRFYAPVMRNPEPNGGTMVELPCTKPVLDAALGIISHSPFNLEVARQNHPEGWQAPYRTIPQMVPMPLSAESESPLLRAELGFTDSALIIATFGHVAWTKWGDRLLEAFLDSALSNDRKMHLVYVGELARDPFGQGLSERITAAALGDRIRVTGFLDELSYSKYLRVADLAVQLRTKSRGGTPKGVLDCLAHGVPVIVNDDASYRDYPDGVVCKLPANPTLNEIASVLTELTGSQDLRDGYALRGREHVRQHHDPKQCAGQYAAAIHECMERARLATQSAAVETLAPLAARCDSTLQSAQALASFVVARPAPSFRRRRMFVDVSFIAVHDHESGIQRVVKKVIRHLYTANTPGLDTVAVYLHEGQLRVASKWLSAKGLLHPHEIDSIEPEREVEFGRGDILFMLDSSWARYREFYPFFAQAREAGAKVFTAVYDLLPIRLPVDIFVEGGQAWFRSWLMDAINSSDVLITISRAEAMIIEEFIQQNPELERRPHIGFWHLGSDIADNHLDSSSSDIATRMGSRPYLLMVGTIEPRKLHDVALRAMELLWSNGLNMSLCIAGKHGWLREDFMDRLRNHSQLNRRLFLFEHPSDADISHLYTHATGLMFLSRGEGFGLPLVEAANHGVPILCSELPVFREICGDFATYIPGSSPEPEQVAASVKTWLEDLRNGKVPDSREMPRLTWEQSAESLRDLIVNEKWIN